MSFIPNCAPQTVPPPAKRRQSPIRALLLALLLLFAPAFAWADTGFWEEPAFPDRPLRGPGAALGVVVYNHGNDDFNEQHRAPVQPFVRLLAEDGWDVIKFARLRAADDVHRAEEALEAEVASLQRRGYRRIVLAGPSRGGWLALMVATRRPVFAVIATAPGGYGTKGDGPRRSLEELRARLPRILPGTRVMIADFANDPRVDSVGGRGAMFRRALADLPHVVIDRPQGFPGHTAAMTGRFARIYGGCVQRFVSPAPLPADFSCDTASGLAVGADLPLPPDAARVPPRGLLGRWVGIYPNGDARVLVVTQADGSQLNAVWSWSSGPTGKRERAPGFERLSCTVSGTAITCPRPKGVALFSRRNDKSLQYQWIPADTRQKRLTMELSRPGQW
ncbi:MAG: hypothetical protein H7Y60_06800 [Rhodospirillaceae bacterium]|nr:hypothetical protein [Rhodospirillales bacterium]